MRVVRLRLWVIIVLALLFLSGIIYYASKVIIWYQHVNENQEVIKEIKKNIKVKEEKVEIDFDALKAINPDTVGYIKVNHTNIDYIVVKGNNNNYYLNHNFEKKWNVAGWVFGDYRNHFDETDKNLIIYGHNTKDGSMFDSLINVLEKDWYKNPENHIITLITEMGTYQYQVFSTYSIIPEEYYITTYFSSDDQFEKFVKELKTRSIYDYEVEVSGEDQILTLSSCIGEGYKRVVLHAKLIEKEE
ncbi:MAG: class B sortase [Bacilli bacterium]|nr:class B sortase [Bacilli bacterium]